MFEWNIKATNQIFLDENTGGKGKYFKTRFLQPGLVKYSFGVCVLEKDIIDKFIQGFVGVPIIIGHHDVTPENADELSCGNLCHIWYDETDGWYWGDGILNKEEAIQRINNGESVSCQYEITEYANNTTGALHNGNPYDKVILNGKPEHIAIVDNPRYENAFIAINALDKTEDKITGEIVVDIPPQEVKQAYLDGILQAINEIKETDMFSKLFRKKENKMDKDELKSLFMECLSELTAKNESEKEEEKKEDEKLADDKMAENEDDKKDDKKDEEDAENKCKNEVVDKRDIIRQIMAIAGKHEDNEEVRTIAKLAEKLAYDKSEVDDKADNKCKNEEKVEEEKEEKKEKAKNSIDEIIGQMSFGSEERKRTTYMTSKKAIELGDKLF